MLLNRRAALKTALLTATGTLAAPAIMRHAALGADPIKVVGIHDASGGLDIYGKPMIACLDFAVSECNAAGGLLGREIKLINYDPQSNIQLYTSSPPRRRHGTAPPSSTPASRRPRARRSGRYCIASTRFISTTPNTKAACATATPSAAAPRRRRTSTSWCAAGRGLGRLVGVVVERLLIRNLYGRMIDTMLATWGLSLALIGLVSMTLGNSVSGFSAPLGSFAVGRFHVAFYDLFLVLAAAALSGGIWVVLRFTAVGLIARGTMQNPAMASALGVAPERVYAATFAAGAALSGLAGGLIAPLSGVVPTMGTAYIAKAFITVITGGAAMLTGTLTASVLLGSV